jgi:hypothetical protein
MLRASALLLVVACGHATSPQPSRSCATHRSWDETHLWDAAYKASCLSGHTACDCRCDFTTLGEAADVLAPGARDVWLLEFGAAVGAWPWPEGMPVIGRRTWVE